AWGHQVHVANDGPSALHLADAHHPDVVILDVGMPHMNGWETARRLRQVPGLESIYLMVISGYGAESDQERSREAGCNVHLTKPVEPDYLRRLLAAQARDSPV